MTYACYEECERVSFASTYSRSITLAVESSIWRGRNVHRDKCSCAAQAVQNEVHVLFHCQHLFVCSLRKKYSFLFFPFCQSFSVEALGRTLIFCMPCLVRQSSISFFPAAGFEVASCLALLFVS